MYIIFCCNKNWELTKALSIKRWQKSVIWFKQTCIDLNQAGQLLAGKEVDICSSWLSSVNWELMPKIKPANTNLWCHRSKEFSKARGDGIDYYLILFSNLKSRMKCILSVYNRASAINSPAMLVIGCKK